MIAYVKLKPNIEKVHLYEVDSYKCGGKYAITTKTMTTWMQEFVLEIVKCRPICIDDYNYNILHKKKTISDMLKKLRKEKDSQIIFGIFLDKSISDPKYYKWDLDIIDKYFYCSLNDGKKFKI
jgi:hypothetical protein